MEFDVPILLLEANREAPHRDEILERLRDGYLTRLQSLPAEQPEPVLAEPEDTRPGVAEPEPAPAEEEQSWEAEYPTPEPEPEPEEEKPKKKRRSRRKRKKK